MDKKAINEQLKYKRIELKARLWTGCLPADLEKWKMVLVCGQDWKHSSLWLRGLNSILIFLLY